MVFQISQQGAALLHERLKDAVRDPKKDIPGIEVCVVNRSGEHVFSGAEGKLGASSEAEPMRTNSIFWLASCSKLILSIACMQLVEKGLLNLDDADQVEQLCPKLKDVKVVQRSQDGSLSYIDKEGRITIRMLLCHTAGFGYRGFNSEIRDWAALHSANAIDPNQPLVAHPGKAFNYGFNMEWVSLMVEAASGERMEDYAKTHIFDPLGLKDLTMFPNKDMKARLSKMNHRSLKDGRLQEGIHWMQYALDMSTKQERESTWQNGGGNFFSSPADFCAIIATLLNEGTAPVTKVQILKPSTVDQMFENQIPEFPNFGRQGIPAAIPEEIYAIQELYPNQPHHHPQGWGLSFMLTLEPTIQGRGPNTASWSGLPNCYWWVDRSKGVGGFIATQIFPFADATVLSLCSDVETLVYSNQLLY